MLKKNNFFNFYQSNQKTDRKNIDKNGEDSIFDDTILTESINFYPYVPKLVNRNIKAG